MNRLKTYSIAIATMAILSLTYVTIGFEFAVLCGLSILNASPIYNTK